ncbi:hypothetical protein NT2_04_04060 [Caenibius tardaugens NBRC 16725]|uniref:Lipase n=1 Tax=Caenibius tardaugens NBRC 16725 TaxID=1219035 RepID=U3A2L1_9SPHN|nr:alpha/beta fold hydrolase [Caenibius tardaugens]AZI35953.1 alpha/beta fold hydrolase [Caenibius tardaugens NBRC 16725]GAD48993.1 hypothetical protein NT2_04_04060 [Caenibius tardaugens NBRC 16725]
MTRRLLASVALPFALLVVTLGVPLSPATAQEQGTLITSDPVADTPPGMQAWRISYWTRDDTQRLIPVTGMVIAPREAAPRAKRPVIAWAHGTSGVMPRCAVSTNPLIFSVTPALPEMIAAGYVVVAPDYPGLGSTGPHGYLAGEETARSVLDAVRAAQQIPGAHAGSRFAVWGESQGGHAALWTAREARTYARDLTLVGTAAAAPPTAIAENFRRASEPNVKAMLTAYVAYSWSQKYGAPLNTLFGKVNRGIATRLAQNNCIELGMTPKLGTVVGILSVRGSIKGKDIGRIEPWASLAQKNSIDPALVPSPVLIAQSVKDPVIAPAVTRNFAAGLCKHRKAVRYVALPGGDHAHSARDSASVTLAWIADRFAGLRAPDDCPRL